MGRRFGFVLLRQRRKGFFALGIRLGFRVGCGFMGGLFGFQLLRQISRKLPAFGDLGVGGFFLGFLFGYQRRQTGHFRLFGVKFFLIVPG